MPDNGIPLRVLIDESDLPPVVLTAIDGLLGDVLDRVAFTDYAAISLPSGFGMSIQLVLEGEAALKLPGVADGFAVVFNSNGAGETLINASYMLAEHGFSARLDDVSVALRFPKSILQPVPDTPGGAEIAVRGSIILNEDYSLAFKGFDRFTLTAAQLGGAGGPLIKDASLRLIGLKFPIDGAPLPGSIGVAGTIVLSDLGVEIGASGLLSADGFVLTTTGDVELGNGIRLHPAGGEPVLKAQIPPGGSTGYRFDVKGELDFPLGDQAGTVGVAGYLELGQTGSELHVTGASIGTGLPRDLSLPGGVTLSHAAVTLAFVEGSGFSVSVNGGAALGGGADIAVRATVRYDPVDPSRIDIEGHVERVELGLSTILGIREARLDLEASTQPFGGSLRLTGAAGGMFYSEGAQNYLLAVENLQAALTFDGDVARIQFVEGRLLLPDVFSAGGGRAALALTRSSPVSLVYDRAARTARLDGSLLLSGLVVSLPGFGGDFTLSLASARLDVRDNRPALAEAAGALRLPRPDDGSQHIDIGFRDAAWDLNGFPAGALYLVEDVSLPAADGIEVVIAGRSSSLTAATGITISPAGGSAAVRLEGHMRLRFATRVLAAEDGGGVSAETHGSITFTPGGPPVFGPGELTLNASFRLGGPGGVLLRNAGLQLLTGPVPNPAAGAPPFNLHVTGELALPAADAVVQVTGALGDRGFDLRATASVHLGDGVWLHPIDAQTPVLAFNSTNRTAEVHAAFQLPADNPTGIAAIEVGGSLTFSLRTDGSLQIDRFQAMSAVGGVAWQLPGQIRLAQAVAALSYDGQAAAFGATLGGKILLSDGNAGGVTFQVAVTAGASDPTRIDIAADVTLERANLFDALYVRSGTLHLEAHSAPARGSVALSNVEAGLFPLDPAAGAAPARYGLTVRGLAATFGFSADGFELAASAGQLALPDLFGLDDGSPAAVAVGNRALRLVYTQARQDLSFVGSLRFTHFGVRLEGSDATLGIRLETATLTFDGGQLPVLSDVAGKVQLPRPDDPRQTVDILFERVKWSLNGMPEGDVILDRDVALPLGGGFELAVLGRQSARDEATGFSAIRRTPGAAVTYALRGSLRLTAPASMVTQENGDQVSAQVKGATLSWTPGGLPEISAGNLTFRGTLHLGGADGLLIQDGTLAFAPDQLIRLLNGSAADHPVTIGVEGSVVFPNQGPTLTLQGGVFEFTGGTLPGSPRFRSQGFAVRADTPLLRGLPIFISKAGLRFRNDTLPLPDLLYPENLEITMSAGFKLTMDDGTGVTGRVDDIKASIIHGRPHVELSGIGFGIDDLEIMNSQFTGVVYLGGLAHFPDRIEDVYLAGKLGGKVQGAGVELLAAFKPVGLPGLLGYCVDVSAGPAGIPLGQTGFLLTGVSGGISLTNRNGDPCEFTNYIALDSQGRPVTHAPASPGIGGAATRGSGPAMPTDRPKMTGIPDCPGDCPPASMNILCQPHPDIDQYPGRAILKFSSLDEAFLARTNLRPALQAFDARFSQAIQNAGAAVDGLAGEIAAQVVDALAPSIGALMPAFTGDVPRPLDGASEALKDPEAYWSKRAKDLLAEALKAAVTQARASAGSPPSLYGLVRDFLYGGLPCPDATVQVTATLSYVGVSSFLSLTGGVNVSTTDTAGVVGHLNVFGIPLGKLRAFLTATSAEGGIEPSICGDLRFVAGPLDLGNLSFLYKVPTYINELPARVMEFGQRIAAPVVKRVVESVTGDVLSDPRYVADPHLALRALSTAEAAGFVARLLRMPLTEQDALTVSDFLLDMLMASWEAYQPSVVLCGKVSPKIFGMPLVPTGGDLASVEGWATKERMGASFAFSPLYLLGRVFPIADLFTGADQAEFGFSTLFPPLEELVANQITGRFNSAGDYVQFVESAFERFLNNAGFTFSYRLSPLGMKIVDLAARAIMPYLLHHPAGPNSGWTRPEDRNAGLPSRAHVLKRALEAGKLAEAYWAGSLAELYPDQAAMHDMMLIRDYFPHGGIIGACKIVMPVALLEPPPVDALNVILNETDPIKRARAAFDYVTHHVLQTQEVGALTFYLPAPNPPTFAVGGRDLTPRELMESIVQLQLPEGPLRAGPAYSLDESFMSGYLHGRLLGIDVGDATVELVPPERSDDGKGYFLVESAAADHPWLNQIVRQASLRFAIRSKPPEVIEDRFAALARELAVYLTRQIGDSAGKQMPELAGLIAGLAIPPGQPTQADTDQLMSSMASAVRDGLPKIAAEAVLGAQALVTAPELAQVMKFDGDLELLAYSPEYEPGYQPDNTSASAAARRAGGIVLRGAMSFGSSFGLGISIPEAELAVTPTPDGTGFPRLAGSFDVQDVQLPLGLPRLDAAQLAVDTQPAAGEPFLAVTAKLGAGLRLGVDFEIRPLRSDALKVAFTISAGKRGTGIESKVLIDPARVSLPVFGADDVVTIYGATSRDPFRLDTAGPWTGTIAFEQVTVRDAFGRAVLRIGDKGAQITGRIQGSGLEWQSLSIEITPDLSLTVFPDRPYQRKLAASADGKAVITVRCDGAFSADLSMPEQRFGVFRLFGPQKGGAIPVSVSNQGLTVAAGTSLAIEGVTDTILALRAFDVRLDGEFTAVAETAALNIPGLCQVTGGRIELNGSPSLTRLNLSAPAVIVFPGTPLASRVEGAGALVIESNGRVAFRAEDITVGVGMPFWMRGNLELGNEPADGGAYLRVADAAVGAALLPGFIARGDVSLSAEAATATLEAGSSFNLADVIDVRAAHWKLDYRFAKGQQSVQIASETPEVRLLGVNIAPPAAVQLTLDSEGRAAAEITSSEDIRMLPGLFEIHRNSKNPVSATVNLRPTAGQAQLTVTGGSLRILKFPAESGWVRTGGSPTGREWLVEQPLDGKVNLLGPIGGPNDPIYFGIPNFATIHLGDEPGSPHPATFAISTSGGAPSLRLKCFAWLLDFRMDVEGEISANGDAILSGGLQTPGAGNKLWEVAGFSASLAPAGRFEVRANLASLKNQYFSLQVPGGTFRLTPPSFGGLTLGWPPIEFRYPGFTLRQQSRNALDFGTLRLPSFGLQGINLLASQGPIQLRRDGDNLVLEARSHQDFLAGVPGASLVGDLRLKITFKAGAAPAVDGQMTAQITMSYNRDGFGVGTASGQVTLNYDTSDTGYPFQGGGNLAFTIPAFTDPTGTFSTPEQSWPSLYFHCKFGPAGAVLWL